MARVRKLLVTLGCGSALYSSLASALGLGEITLHSALSQPLNAEIELLEVGDLSASDVKVGLASVDAFNRAGVDRVFSLNDLRFTAVMRGNRSYIKVVSNKSINEPYLNFIVEVDRPNGRLLREYTLLLDPPGSAPLAATTLAAAPVSNRQPRLPSAAGTRQHATVAGAPPANVPVPAATQGKRYKVTSGDNLWSIAKRMHDAGNSASLNDLMQQIHALNPQAFVGNDRARLRVGQNLLLPDSAPATMVTAGAGVAGPLPGSVSAPLASTPAATGAPAPVATQAALDVASSQLTGAVNENHQLQKALADLQQQVDALKAQMDSKDQQVAALQSAAGHGAVTPPATSAPAPVTGAPVSGAPTPAPVTTPTVTPTGAPLNQSVAPVMAAPVAPAMPVPAPAVVAAPSQPVVVASPAATQPPAPAQDSGTLMAVLLGVLALLVALFGLIFLSRRNKREDRLVVIAPVAYEADELVEPVQVKPVQASRPVVADAAVASAAAVATVVAADIVAHEHDDEVVLAPIEPASAAAADALDGASIYIAYGRYNEALAVLRAAIDKQPERFDLRLRLLDVLGEQNDSIAYAEEEQTLLGMGYNEIQLQHLRARFSRLLSASAAAAAPVISSAPVTPQAAVPAFAEPVAEPVDDFQLNLDDMSLDADWDMVSPFDAAPNNRAKAAEAEAEAAAFHSNLKELPEVFEMHDDEFLSDEVPTLVSKSDKDLLDDEFLDSFIAESDMFNTGAPDSDFDPANSHESATKLDLAHAYIEQGDVEGASHLLHEVIIEGDDVLKQEARELLSRIA